MAKEKSIAKIEYSEDWAKSKYCPSEGEIVIFKFNGGGIKLKIGDGVTNINLLPFYEPRPSYVNEESHSLQI